MEYFNQTDNNGIPSFAHGLQILVADHETLSLMCIASTLEQYSFKVSTAELASSALSMISEQKGRYKLVLANIDLPDMDTLCFLHMLHNKIPVIFMSSEMNVGIARKTLAEGASFFLQKPICSEDLKNVWQHVYWKIKKPVKKPHEPRCEINFYGEEVFQDIKTDEHGMFPKPRLVGGIKIKETDGVSRPATGHDDMQVDTKHARASKWAMKQPIDDEEGQERSKMKGKMNIDPTVCETTGNNEEGMENHESNGKAVDKKTRAVWTSDLHLKFTAALNALGNQKARPKLIHKMMNVPGITVRQVASHLQKYKNQVQRIQDVSTAFPSLSMSSSWYNNRSQFPPSMQNTILAQNQQGTSSFGANAAQFVTPNSSTRYGSVMPSFNNHDYGSQSMYTRPTVLSDYTNHCANNPNETYLRTRAEGLFQNMNKIGETSCFMSGGSMYDIFTKNQYARNLPIVTNYMTPDVAGAASPYVSANTFWLPNEQPPIMNHEQCYTPAWNVPFSSSQNQHQFSTEVTTGVLEHVPEQTASGNAANTDIFQAWFDENSQKLDTAGGDAALLASSSNNNQPQIGCSYPWQTLEKDPECSLLGNAENAGDPDLYFERLSKVLFEGQR